MRPFVSAGPAASCRSNSAIMLTAPLSERAPGPVTVHAVRPSNATRRLTIVWDECTLVLMLRVAILFLTPFLIAAAFSAAQVHTVPAGAIMAFSEECPKGWSTLEDSNGRFLIAAGTVTIIDSDGKATDKELRPGDIGGQMYHEHTGRALRVSGPSKDNANRDSRSTGPHEHELEVNPSTDMPRYIAVRFCVVPRIE